MNRDFETREDSRTIQTVGWADSSRDKPFLLCQHKRSSLHPSIYGKVKHLAQMSAITVVNDSQQLSLWGDWRDWTWTLDSLWKLWASWPDTQSRKQQTDPVSFKVEGEVRIQFCSPTLIRVLWHMRKCACIFWWQLSGQCEQWTAQTLATLIRPNGQKCDIVRHHTGSAKFFSMAWLV